MRFLWAFRYNPWRGGNPSKIVNAKHLQFCCQPYGITKHRWRDFLLWKSIYL
ncbi:MAG: hypothetical protein LBK44_04545 [Spirochaetales bacterium]|nr:hypothetical protein [Spirochaetales bacterium]